MTELVGERRSERQEPVAPAGYRNGHSKPRRLSMTAGTTEVSRLRVRDPEQRLESRLMSLFVRRTEEVGALLPQLYLEACSGMAHRSRLRRSSGCGRSGSWSMRGEEPTAGSSRCSTSTIFAGQRQLFLQVIAKVIGSSILAPYYISV